MSLLSTSHPSSFVILEIHEQLGPPGSPPLTDWAPVRGDMTSKFEFTILGNPIGIERSDRTQWNQGYYVIQAWGVADSTNQIHINGHALQGLDIPPNAYEGWQAWTGFFTKPLLKQGINHVYIKRDLSSESSFLIGSMLIGWGEFPLVPDREGQRPGEGKIPRISGRRESPPESA